MSTRHTILATPIGDLTVVRDDAGITGVYFPHHWTRPDRTAFGPRVESGFEDVAGQLADYFAGHFNGEAATEHQNVVIHVAQRL